MANEHQSGADESADEQTRRTRAERLRRAERLLGGGGSLLPDTTSDERGVGWNDDGGTSRDDQIARDVPPHYGKD